tara:strand:+ start:1564 stop:2088 length:525 start_codon:yes stop_codon:yes gene_type:complete
VSYQFTHGVLKLFESFKAKIKSFFEYEFKDENSIIKNNLGKLYLFLHFIVGFFCLWLTYFQLTMIVEQNGNSLFWKSGLETLYLAVGVVWGNIGWDYYSNIKKGIEPKEIVNYLINFSAPCIFIFPIIISVIQAIVGTQQHGLFWGYYQLTSSLFWFSIVAFILLKVAKRVRNT